MEYSQIILDYMDRNGVTGYKLSKATGISVSLFSKWKTNPTSKIGSTTLMKIAEYFNVTPDVLLGNEDKKISPPPTGDELTNEEKRILKLLRGVSEDDKNRLLGALELLSSHDSHKDK